MRKFYAVVKFERKLSVLLDRHHCTAWSFAILNSQYEAQNNILQ